MSPFRHPSTRRLTSWLASGHPESVGVHIAGCEHCTTLLESEQPPSSVVRAALIEAIEPADGFDERLTASVTEAVRRRQAVRVFADLFGLGWRTPRAIMQHTDPLKGTTWTP